MTMEEVNERFPMLKYKAWMTARAEEGLSTAGGVAAPAGSRPASLRNVDGIIADSKDSQDLHRPTTPVPQKSSEEVENAENEDSPDSTTKNSPEIDTGEMPESPKQMAEKKTSLGQDEKTNDDLAEGAEPVGTSTEHVDDEMDEDDQIQMAVPTEMMAMGAGDSCAICIDQLEDDEDVRGLSCGHAFHAHCLDPWLTSRRACCPLCKADYYVPKPRPEGEAAAEAERHERGRRQVGPRQDVLRPPQDAFQRQGGGRLLFPSRLMAAAPDEDPRSRSRFVSTFTRPQRPARNQREMHAQTQPQLSTADGQQPNTWRSRMGAMVPSVRAPRFMRRNNNATTNTGAPEIHTGSNTSPSQLEAGQR